MASRNSSASSGRDDEALLRHGPIQIDVALGAADEVRAQREDDRDVTTGILSRVQEVADEGVLLRRISAERVGFFKLINEHHELATIDLGTNFASRRSPS